MAKADHYSFQQGQRQFAAHLRHPQKNAAPDDVEDRRMNIYRNLIYKNIEGFIRKGFPVIRKLYSDEDWHAMVRDFIDRHQSSTPYFLQIGQEFLDYLEHQRAGAGGDDPPFLLELARYEWAELALYVAGEDIPEEGVDTGACLLDHPPVLSPLAWNMVFNYPVHEIGPGRCPQQPEEVPVCLVVYRNRQDKVGFTQINPVTARLLDLCQQQYAEGAQGDSGRQLLERICAEISHPSPQLVIDGGAEALAQLRSLDIILGVYK